MAYYEAIVRQVRDYLRREQQSGQARSLDPNLIAYALIGVCYFQALDRGQPPAPAEVTLDLMVDFALHGLSGPRPWSDRPDFQLFTLPPPAPLRADHQAALTKGEQTRRAIFHAAERVFGRRGFNRAGVADLTRAAGVAQGTFYVHFQSKQELMKGLVEYINREMRRAVQRSAVLAADRRGAELYGLAAFYEFLKEHRDIYRLVPEFEMIGREVGQWYYRKIARGYTAGLEKGIEAGEIRALPADFLAWSLMGLSHFVGLRWIVWNPSPQADLPRPLFADLMEFVFHGLETVNKD
ncbi:MAG: TetR/AcrR family transcriptional regulator [Thermodesulfobacteriota bacterium]